MFGERVARLRRVLRGLPPAPAGPPPTAQPPTAQPPDAEPPPAGGRAAAPGPAEFRPRCRPAVPGEAERQALGDPGDPGEGSAAGDGLE